ncbi:hypothetical protein PM8797T_02469 [Gimesia maris DSM 8797]|nr:hypothetical protein PM8797T_02469 [Gimesia maris DSM 8797]
MGRGVTIMEWYLHTVIQCIRAPLQQALGHYNSATSVVFHMIIKTDQEIPSRLKQLLLVPFFACWEVHHLFTELLVTMIRIVVLKQP